MLVVVLLAALGVVLVIGIAFLFANGARSNKKRPISEVQAAPGSAANPVRDRAAGLD